MKSRLVLLAWAFLLPSTAIAETSTADASHSFRTDAGDKTLPWYRLEPGEFPPAHSEHRLAGELVEADFIHRAGQFRQDGSGELIDFRLPSFGVVRYLHTEADLRDVPLGTHLQFFLYRDKDGAFSQAAAIEDDATQLPLADAQRQATEQQRKKHIAFLKARGLAGWIDRVEGKTLSVTLFGDPISLQALFKDEGIVPTQWVSEHRRIDAVVANDELRTYNPPVDRQNSEVLEFETFAADAYGCGGARLKIRPNLMLEGFRKGRVIRLFVQSSWKVEDMPFGECLYTETPGAAPQEEDLNQYPYRTDFGNESLAWYRLAAGKFPPLQSHHLLTGELIKMDADQRSGQFRVDVTGESIEFSLLPFGAIQYLNADADPGDLPLNTRYRFLMYQDAKGAFTKTAGILDEFTHLSNRDMTYRVEAIDLKQGKLQLAWQLGMMKDEKDHPVRPPDLGHSELTVDEKTRVWKGDKRISLADLAIGDELLFNRTGATSTNRGRGAEIWDGADTHSRATKVQRAKHAATIKEKGAPGWIEKVVKNQLTITFFAGARRDFLSLLNGDPPGRIVHVVRADEQLRPVDKRSDKMSFDYALPEESTFGTYGSSGVRWVLGSGSPPDDYRAGQIIRVFEEGWATKANP